MSHFTVLVCLPAEAASDLTEHLNAIMAPWDENTRVEPYREYEAGSPEEFWWVGAVRRGAEHFHNNTIDDSDRTDIRFGQPNKTDAEVHDEYAEDAQWAERIGTPATWERVVAAYNEKWGDDDKLLYDAESDRAYTMSTYNPESKWDWWTIGGRWSEYFPIKPGYWSGDGFLINRSMTRCDGGQINLLDFKTMCNEAADKASKRYDQWEAICADTPAALPWSHFCGLIDLKEMTIDEARAAYGQQPRIIKAREAKLDNFFDDVVDEFLPDREEYIATARLNAVPGYALVTLDGKWMAPGEMGWFGMSSDTDGSRYAYKVQANAYLEALPDDAIVVLLDCHI